MRITHFPRHCRYNKVTFHIVHFMTYVIQTGEIFPYIWDLVLLNYYKSGCETNWSVRVRKIIDNEMNQLVNRPSGRYVNCTPHNGDFVIFFIFLSDLQFSHHSIAI